MRMNTEGFPLHEKDGGVVIQPVGSTVVQYNVLNDPEPPRDHIIWSLCCFIYSNPCCLGLAAFIFSIKARDRKVVGDVEGARHYGATARCLNIWATLIHVFLFILLIVLIVYIQVVITRVRDHPFWRTND